MRRPVYNENSPNCFFPSLRGSQSPSQTVGSFIKQLLPRSKGGAARFEKFAVDEIPQNASAGGARPGVCNTLVSSMPAELAVHTTGHDMRSQSSLWEYVDVSHAIAQVGATVLAGFKPFPWGTLGIGPKPASLNAVELFGVGTDKLDSIIDDLYRFDSASPPQYLRGGTLRPAVRAAFASIESSRFRLQRNPPTHPAKSTPCLCLILL